MMDIIGATVGLVLYKTQGRYNIVRNTVFAVGISIIVVVISDVIITYPWYSPYPLNAAIDNYLISTPIDIGVCLILLPILLIVYGTAKMKADLKPERISH